MIKHSTTVTELQANHGKYNQYNTIHAGQIATIRGIYVFISKVVRDTLKERETMGMFHSGFLMVDKYTK